MNEPAARKSRRAADDAAFPLPAECTIHDAAALREALLPLVPVAETVILDVSALTRIDTACLQVLAAFAAERRQQDRHVDYRGKSDSLEESAALLGIATVLGLTLEGTKG